MSPHQSGTSPSTSTSGSLTIKIGLARDPHHVVVELERGRKVGRIALDHPALPPLGERLDLPVVERHVVLEVLDAHVLLDVPGGHGARPVANGRPAHDLRGVAAHLVVLHERHRGHPVVAVAAHAGALQDGGDVAVEGDLRGLARLWSRRACMVLGGGLAAGAEGRHRRDEQQDGARRSFEGHGCIPSVQTGVVLLAYVQPVDKASRLGPGGRPSDAVPRCTLRAVRVAGQGRMLKEVRPIMQVFERLSGRDFRKVVFCNDNATGLRAIIALHDVTLGPALGGIRMLPYRSDDEAFDDVLRLARGMTYKASIAGVDLGGGKSVIIGDSRTDKTPELMRAMGRFIDEMGGEYIAGQDIGTGAHDLAHIRSVTAHATCVHESAGGGGDPSRTTAYGVHLGIRAVLKATTGSDSFEGRHIAVQGLGHVGYEVARFCGDKGARLTVTDITEASVARAVRELGAQAVEPDAIYDVECDIFSPNAIGAVINDDTIPRLRCPGVAGGANNALASLRHGVALAKLGIVYGPDYLVNSGGLIRCQEEAMGRSVADDVISDKVGQIYHQTLRVIRIAAAEGISTAAVADRIAEERIAAAKG